MTSAAVVGAFEGLGKGLSILGQQGLQDRSEAARMELMQKLNLERDDKEREFKMGQEDRANAAALEGGKAKLALEQAKMDQERAIAEGRDKATIEAAKIKAGSKDKSDKVKSTTTLDSGEVLTVYENGNAVLLNPTDGTSRQIAKPGESPTTITDTVMAEIEAQAAAEVESMAGYGTTDESDFQEYGGKRENAKTALMAKKLADRGYSPEVIKRRLGIDGGQNILGGPITTNNAPAYSDESLKSVVAKVKPDDKEEFLLEAEKKYGKATADRMAAMFDSSEPENDPVMSQTDPGIARRNKTPMQAERLKSKATDSLKQLREKADLAGTEYTKQVGRGGKTKDTHPQVDVEKEIAAIAQRFSVPIETVREIYAGLGD